MSNLCKTSSLALALAVSTLMLAPLHAEAKSAFMQDCSAKWTAAKADGSAAGTKWPDFMKTHCGTSADQATAPAPVAPMTKATKKKTVVATAPAQTTSDTFMQNCSASWKAMKDAGTVPAGMKWGQFVKQSCVVNASAPVDNTATNETPPEPNSPAWDSQVVKTVDKNGKAFTPGQIAAHQRMKECGAEWRTAKTANNLPAGEKWPQYWSACNTRLKG